MLCLVVLVAFALIVHASRSLFLDVSGPVVVTGIVDLAITTTVTNTGDETLVLLNDPRGPLSDLPADIFSITNRHGKSPAFVGIKLKYVPEDALSANNSSAFTTLAPGRSVRIAHNVSSAYDFSISGSGQYVVTTRNLNTFYYTSGGRVSTITAKNSRLVHTVNITGALGYHQDMPNGQDCEDWQNCAIRGAIPIAKQYVANALSELAQKGHHGARFKRWFGPSNARRLSIVASHFEALTGNDYSSFTYTCDTTFCADRPGMHAYTYPDQFGQIHLCDQFFRAPVGGSNSRASAIVHESSHFTRNGGTEDHTYGKRLARELARSYADLAVANTDNYEYFAVGARGADAGDEVMSFQEYMAVDVVLD